MRFPLQPAAVLLPFHLPRLSEGRHTVIYIIHQEQQQQLENKKISKVFI
jgi:hypothetical protein